MTNEAMALVIALPLLGALAAGYDGALVLGRHPATCRLDGSEEPARDTVERVARLAGDEPARRRYGDEALRLLVAKGAEVATADAATASWESTTPFGVPVAPLVATTRASPGSTGRASRRVVSSPARSTTTPTPNRARRFPKCKAKSCLPGSAARAFS